jgi:hypothetical protein
MFSSASCIAGRDGMREGMADMTIEPTVGFAACPKAAAGLF